MVERECPVCSTLYQADPGRLKFGRQTTCSRKCSYALRSQKLTKAETFQCATCGESVELPPSRTQRVKHGALYCSRECHYEGRSQGLTKRVVTKPYVYTPEGKAAQVAAARKPKGKRVHHWMVCQNCKIVFDDPNWGRPRISGWTFCSLECCNTYRRGENNPAWRGGYRRYYGPDWRPLRRAARERDNYTCQHCGIHQDDLDKKIPVHHINPVSSFEEPNDANTLENVVCLCPPCHMKEEWKTTWSDRRK
jgi:hypothetical protein